MADESVGNISPKFKEAIPVFYSRCVFLEGLEAGDNSVSSAIQTPSKIIRCALYSQVSS